MSPVKSILFASCGRRCQLLQDCKKSLGDAVRIVGTDMSPTAPALYCADAAYIVPSITDPSYIDRMLEICRTENVGAVTTLIDPEIAVLARHRERFESEGVIVLAPQLQTAELAFDKVAFARYLTERGLPTVKTYGSIDEFESAFAAGDVCFPVFVKPRTGSGSVGAHRVESLQALCEGCNEDPDLVIQECMPAEEVDVDVYVDALSGSVVQCFSKRKLEMRIGGASKTVSFFDKSLCDLVGELIAHFQFCGPLDIDFFVRDGRYIISEINPRFGGAYIHAFGCGVDFFKLIARNMANRENQPLSGGYEEGAYMLMYDGAMIVRPADLVEGGEYPDVVG